MTSDAEAHEASLAMRLGRVAASERLLVVSDFDGTLAPIVDHPDDVRPDPAALAALRALSRMRVTAVAVLSGRARAILVRHLGSDPAITLVGSHGAEFGDEPSPSAADGGRPDARVEALLEALAEELDALALDYPGSLVERKPTGVAFHYRNVSEEYREEAAAAARRLATHRSDLRVQPGHFVVELVTGTTDKGDAIDALRRRCGATATVYVGDDQTDEHAFARLGDGDLGVRVGAGETRASVRVPGQGDVAGLFRQLGAMRAEFLGTP